MHWSAEEKQRELALAQWGFKSCPWHVCRGQHCSHQGERCALPFLPLIPCAHSSCPTPLVLGQNNHCCSEIFTFGDKERILSFGFKNRIFMVDFCGLMKNTVLIPTHTWSLPLLGPFSCPEVSLHKLSRFLSGDLVPGRSVDSPRKGQVDSALRFALLSAVPPPAGQGDTSWLLAAPPTELPVF